MTKYIDSVLERFDKEFRLKIIGLIVYPEEQTLKEIHTFLAQEIKQAEIRGVRKARSVADKVRATGLDQEGRGILETVKLVVDMSLTDLLEQLKEKDNNG